jgi:peptide/nickel transport system substrate-binding protein
MYSQLKKSTDHKTRSRLAPVAVLALLFSLVACSGNSGSDSESPDTSAAAAGPARDLIIARAVDITTLDPERMWCDTCMIILKATYEQMINVDPNDVSNLLPGLAERWEVNDTSTEFTFHLNPKATFADGTPVTSADVKWSWERILNIKAGASFMPTGLLVVETPDPLTAIAKFKAPNAPFLSIAAAAMGMSIINSKMATELGLAKSGPGADLDKAAAWFDKGNSAGSGIYTITDYKARESITLTRNENYWGTKAKYPSITIKNVAEASTQLQMLQQGDIDIAMNIAFDSLTQLQGDSNIVAEPIESFNFIYLNLAPWAAGGKDLTDVKVRQAIRLAIDYNGLLQNTLAGYGRLQATNIPNGLPGTEGLELPAQDIAKAKELMTAAGKADGFTIDAQFADANIYGVQMTTMYQQIQQDLKKINITLNLVPIASAKYADVYLAKKIAFGNVYFAPDYMDASEYITYFARVPGSNRGGWAPTGVTAADDDAAQAATLAKALAITDVTERGKLYKEVGQAMIDDAYSIPLLNPDVLFAHQKDIAGIGLSPCCVLDVTLLK